jgi:hydroxyacylglutathione hydrolase
MTRVEAIPCLSDNYAYYLPDLGVVVDPSEAPPVLAAIGDRPLRAVWCTHHHGDHVGGVPGLKERYPGLVVVGSRYDRDRIPGLTRTVSEGDTVDGARILEIPGHTLGAIAFVLDDAVFTGDTLFLAGCGRLFEGTPPIMVDSLTKLRALPDATRVYGGHEYTAKNIEFARTLGCAMTREPGPPPGTIGEEKATNPFLRWDDPELAERVGTEVGVECFAEVRRRKDRF